MCLLLANQYKTSCVNSLLHPKASLARSRSIPGLTRRASIHIYIVVQTLLGGHSLRDIAPNINLALDRWFGPVADLPTCLDPLRRSAGHDTYIQSYAWVSRLKTDARKVPKIFQAQLWE